MRTKEKQQIKSSILITAGMVFLLISLNEFPSYIKYPSSMIAIGAFLFRMYCFAKDAIGQLSSAKKSDIN